MNRGKVNQIFLLLFGFLLLSSCSTPAKFIVRRDLDKTGEQYRFHREQKSVVWLLIDGVNSEVFRKMLFRGDLPNFGRHVFKRGVYTFQAVSSHPPSTYPNVAAQLTGKFPGHVGVPNNHYLDDEHKERLNLVEFPGVLKAQNLLKHELSIFQYLRAQKLYTVSVTDLVASSANVQVIDLFKTGVKEVNRQWKRIDEKTFFDLDGIINETSKSNQLPVLIFAHLIGPDSEGHVHGVSSKIYRDSIKYLDREFGKFVKVLKKRGYYNNTAFVISSDHGQIPIKNRFNFDDFIYEIIKDKPEGYCKLHSCSIDDNKIDNVVLLHGAERDAFIYFKIDDFEEFYKQIKNNGWRGRISIHDLENYKLSSGKQVNIIEKIASARGVGLLFLRESESRFHIFSRVGHSLILRKTVGKEARYAYQLLTGEDPLGLDLVRVPASEEYLSSRDWLILTENSTYPDLVPQIPELFQTPKAGDLIVYAAPGYSFDLSNLGGHGGGTRPEIYTPFIFGGEEIAHRELESMRTIDILPTILHYLGLRVNPPDRIDGEPICVFTRYCVYLSQ